MPPLVTAVEKPSSVGQEVRDDTVAKQIKETKKGGTKRDKGLSKTRDWGNWGRLRKTRDWGRRWTKEDEGVWIGSISKLITHNPKHITQKYHSFLKTLSHSEPKTENFYSAPISQNHAPHLNTQFFHFLVEPTACKGQKVGFLSSVSSSLSFHPKHYFCLPISTDTHTPNVRERFVVFSFPFPSLYFCLHILKTHRLQTVLMKYQHFHKCHQNYFINSSNT